MTCNQKYHATGCYVKALHNYDESKYWEYLYMNYFGKRILYNSNDSFSNTNRCRYMGHTYCLWNTHRMLENKILIEDMYTSSWKIKHCLKHCVTHTCISYLRIHTLRGYDASIKHSFSGVSKLRKPIKEQNTLYMGEAIY